MVLIIPKRPHNLYIEACDAIRHLVLFSSLTKRWPEQKEAYLALADQLEEVGKKLGKEQTQEELDYDMERYSQR